MSLLTTSEFADLADLSPAQVRALIAAGTLPASEIGGRFVIDLEEVEDEAPGIYARTLENIDEDEESEDDGYSD